MPTHTSPETAEGLKLRTKACRRFLVFTMRQSNDSRWVPWQLGLSDGFKTPRHMVVYPETANAENSDWAKEDYLGVYDRILDGDLEGRLGGVEMVLNYRCETVRELSDGVGDR